MIRDKYYLTTPIYYINDKPHLGHAYTTIVGDVLARYYRLRGREVLYTTGVDENSQKSVTAAVKAGFDDVQKYVDQMSTIWQTTFKELGITHDDFIRTTEARHQLAVEKFWTLVKAKGDIYLGSYAGWYCDGCEAYVTDNEAGADKFCPIHQKPLRHLEEQNYFFKAAQYKERLLKHIQERPDFIQPIARRNEIVSYLENHFGDFSISRPNNGWGIPVPGDDTHVLYVWFDALINYLTVVGFADDEDRFRKWWPADLHLVGKDIIKFHVALWPAMLMSAGLPLPKQIFAHGFFTINGQKMSKSLGNAIDPLALIKDYGNDALRYYLLADFLFGEDGDFSEARFATRYHNELAHGIGNLASRVISMAEKYFQGAVPDKAESPLVIDWSSYEQAIERLAFHEALKVVVDISQQADKFVNDEAPWMLAKNSDPKLSSVIYALLETLRQLAVMLKPLLPDTADKLMTHLGLTVAAWHTPYDTLKAWGGLQSGTMVHKGEALFPDRENQSV